MIIGVMTLLAFVVVTKFNKLDKRAGWMMMPYLCWVAFALLLNFKFALLN